VRVEVGEGTRHVAANCLGLVNVTIVPAVTL
jgi:hypothetical protein